MFDAWTGNPDRVAFLECIQTNRVRRHLTGNDDHWNGIHIRSRQTGNGIGNARTRGHEAHANFIGAAGIGVSSMDGGLFVAHQNMLEFAVAENGVVDVEHCATRVAEHMFNTFFGQATYDDFCTGDFFTDLVIANYF